MPINSLTNPCCPVWLVCFTALELSPSSRCSLARPSVCPQSKPTPACMKTSWCGSKIPSPSWPTIRSHPLGIQRENLLVETRQTSLVFADQLRLERTTAISRRGQGYFTQVAMYRLAAAPIATVRRLLSRGRRWLRGGRGIGGRIIAVLRQGFPPPKWTSISVFSIRSSVDFIISRISSLTSSAVFAMLAISPASCSARDCNETSMCQTPIQKKGCKMYPFLLADTIFLQGPRGGCGRFLPIGQV